MPLLTGALSQPVLAKMKWQMPHWPDFAVTTGARFTLSRGAGYGPADAQDLVQGFFAYFLQSKAYARTNPLNGRFRSFLLASLKNYMSDVWDRTRAFKRDGDYEFLLMDDQIDEVEALCSRETIAMSLREEQQYERSWASALVARALEKIRAEFNGEAKAHLFSALKPFLTAGVGLLTV